MANKPTGQMGLSGKKYLCNNANVIMQNEGAYNENNCRNNQDNIFFMTNII